jgi:hypothetical protein
MYTGGRIAIILVIQKYSSNTREGEGSPFDINTGESQLVLSPKKGTAK